jgi:hypothetical protein
VWCYTKFYLNLGLTASQRGESYHPIIREITNCQLSIKQSAKHLTTKVLFIFKDIFTDEELFIKKYPKVI